MFDQIGSTYYNHQDVPFLIVVTELWHDDKIMKRIFVIVSEHNRQDTHYVLDSLNFMFSLKVFEEINTVFLISDNASNLKNGYDLFNIFSANGPLSGSDRRKKFRFIRINTWYESGV
jgi:hypothetical protein